MPSATALDEIEVVLKRYWGFDSFRPLQKEIITSIMQGHDTLALLPTGGGKSLCYQLPAMAMDGVCVVVSPLIALMKDQVQHLVEKGIKAACLVSGMNIREQELVLNNALYGKCKILYVSPERLKNKTFLGHFRQMKVSMLAVDEAHCISQWGYDFRPSYLEIVNIKQYIPSVPVLALTATATPAVADDIAKRLLFQDGYNRFQSSFVRPNLSYMVISESDKLRRLLNIVKTVGGSGIVYVRNRRRTQEVSQVLQSAGLAATFYHAGLSAKERDMRQSVWMRGSGMVMVATNAFGMGIDKPDVRFVVHLDLPDSLEAYFQEAGRAGRDGLKSYAVILYGEGDLETLYHGFDTSFPSMTEIRNAYRAICNYYQIPVGSGEGKMFDFDLEGICRNYGFTPANFYSAVRFLEKDGLLSVPDREEVLSKLHVLIDNEQLYRFRVENKRYDLLIQELLRTYGGLFSDFVTISERELSRKCYIVQVTVEKMLLHLDALGIVSYKRHTSKPQIEFVSPRIDANNLYISDENYHQLKLSAQTRLKAIVEYVTACQKCRSRQLVSYFGENVETDCGICDVCLSVHKNAPDPLQLRTLVVDCLRQEAVPIATLVERLHILTEDKCFKDDAEIVEMVRKLLDQRVIRMDKEFRLFV